MSFRMFTNIRYYIGHVCVTVGTGRNCRKYIICWFRVSIIECFEYNVFVEVLFKGISSYFIKFSLCTFEIRIYLKAPKCTLKL
jgi:hypothetical protein